MVVRLASLSGPMDHSRSRRSLSQNVTISLKARIKVSLSNGFELGFFCSQRLGVEFVGHRDKVRCSHGVGP